MTAKKKEPKVWNEDSIYSFTDSMENEIQSLLSVSKFANSWVEQIVDISTQKLKAMGKSKLITFCISILELYCYN